MWAFEQRDYYWAQKRALEADVGPYRLRQDRGGTWPPTVADPFKIFHRRIKPWALAAVSLAVPVMLLDFEQIQAWLGSLPVQTDRAVLSFGIAFIAANLVGIALFELTHGPAWWFPALVGSCATSLTFSVIYYPAALAGMQQRWGESALMHFLLFGAESVLLLIPYRMLREAMRPLHGLNGY